MKVAIALQVPTEAKLCLNPPITQPVTGCISAQVLPVLHAQRRTVDVMLPDGNCLFRAFSKALFAVQSGHITLRKLLVTFVESNKGIFKGLCNGTLESHCARMRKASTFGTQAELQAAASLFQVYIYVFYKRSEERGWEWCGTSHTTRTSSMLSTSPKLLVTFTSRYSTMKQDLILIS